MNIKFWRKIFPLLTTLVVLSLFISSTSCNIAETSTIVPAQPSISSTVTTVVSSLPNPNTAISSFRPPSQSLAETPGAEGYKKYEIKSSDVRFRFGFKQTLFSFEYPQAFSYIAMEKGDALTVHKDFLLVDFTNQETRPESHIEVRVLNPGWAEINNVQQAIEYQLEEITSDLGITQTTQGIQYRWIPFAKVMQKKQEQRVIAGVQGQFVEARIHADEAEKKFLLVRFMHPTTHP